MLINKVNLAKLEANFNKNFGKALLTVDPHLAALCNFWGSRSYNLYDIYALRVDAMRAKGLSEPRIKKNISLYDSNYSTNGTNTPVKHTEFAHSTVAISRFDIMADSFHVYDDAAVQLAEKSGQHIDRRVARALLFGTTSNTQYVGGDNQPIFSQTHTFQDNPALVQSNMVDLALNTDNLMTALKTMRGFKDNWGQPLDVAVNPSDKPTLVVGNDLWEDALVALEMPGAPVISSLAQSSNVSYGRCNLAVSTYLDVEPKSWYLAAPMSGINPLAYYTFEPITFISRIALDDPHVFEFNEYLFGAHVHDHCFGVNWWQLLKSTGGNGIGSSLYSGTTLSGDLA